MEKFGAALTVKLTVVVCVRLPLVPVIVMVDVPVAAELLAVRVRMLEPVVLVGLNAAVTPEGKPDADKLTLPEKPPRSVSVIVLVSLVPWTIDTLAGEAASEKSPSSGALKPTSLVVSGWRVIIF